MWAAAENFRRRAARPNAILAPNVSFNVHLVLLLVKQAEANSKRQSRCWPETRLELKQASYVEPHGGLLSGSYPLSIGICAVLLTSCHKIVRNLRYPRKTAAMDESPSLTKQLRHFSGGDRLSRPARSVTRITPRCPARTESHSFVTNRADSRSLVRNQPIKRLARRETARA